jgi:hypothetical protein
VSPASPAIIALEMVFRIFDLLSLSEMVSQRQAAPKRSRVQKDLSAAFGLAGVARDGGHAVEERKRELDRLRG